MNLEAFYQDNHQSISISAEMASRFAKEVADDFNPIHDTDAKRFCVPGDLLFALILKKYGLSQEMKFTFEGMLNADRPVVFDANESHQINVLDEAQNKAYLCVKRNGSTAPFNDAVAELLKGYVAFSGHNFPHILVPLMEQHGVMINPARPLIMYESMSLSLTNLNLKQPTLSLGESSLKVDGKRGDALLSFEIHDQGNHIGHGVKKMILSGLRPYCGEEMKRIVAGYTERKKSYQI